MQRVLLTAGIALFVLGLAWPWLGGWFGRLPGDLRWERPGFGFYLPLGTSVLLSIALSVLLTLLAWFWRR